MAVLLDVIHDLGKLRERQTHIAVRAAVVERDLSALGVVNGSAGEAHVRNEASLLVPLLRCQQEVLTA